MSPIEKHSSVHCLAEHLADDIRRKGLRPGDRYLTAGEVTGVFGVSRTMAHRAMTILVDQKLLVRRRKQGTFVGPNARGADPVAVRTVHILLTTDRGTRRVCSLEQLVETVRGAMPDAVVCLDFLPPGDPLSFVKQLTGEGAPPPDLAGVLALGCPREVYRWLQDCRVPTSVVGTVDPVMDRLASVDLDWRQAGHLIAEHLIGQGHRRLALLIADHWRPGDNRHLEGVLTAMAAAGLPPDALTVRSLPPDEGVVTDEVRRLLEGKGHPTGFMCWRPEIGDVVRRAAVARGLAPGRDLDIGVTAIVAPAMGDLDMPHCRPEIGGIEVIVMAARRLAELIAGRELDNRHVRIPVSLYSQRTDSSA